MTYLSQKCDDRLVCSYIISKMIIRLGKPHATGKELILPAINGVFRIVVYHAFQSGIIKAI